MVILYFSLPKDPSILLARYTSAASLSSEINRTLCKTFHWEKNSLWIHFPHCKPPLHSSFGTSFLRLPLKVYDGIICLSLIEILSQTHEPVTGQNFSVFVYCIKHHMYLKRHTYPYRTRDRFNITFFFLLDFI